MTLGPLNQLARDCHADNQRWWHDLHTGKKLDRNKGELIALMHSELSEAMEGERKGLMDDHLPHRRSAEVELADLLIRVFDYCGAFGYDLDGAVAEKRAYNDERADHKSEARLAAGGKKVVKRIIAFTGLAGCGKSTAAKYLVSFHGYTRISFADPLKRMLLSLGLSCDEIYGSAKEATNELLCGKTPRSAMQTLGTEWGRDCISPNLWTNIWESRCAGTEGAVVADDLRFHNEVDAVKAQGGIIIRIDGRAKRIGDHISEQNAIKYDLIIDNSGEIASMHQKLDALVRDLSWTRGKAS